MNITHLFRKLLSITLLSMLISSPAQALVIGHFGELREINGLGGSGLSDAKQWLVDQGYSLSSTTSIDASYLSTVDAFYTGLARGYIPSEIDALKNFVDDGGFLFVQQDHDGFGNDWFAPTNNLLSQWGISASGFYVNSSANQAVGSSTWVTTPNEIGVFEGAVHGAFDVMPSDFDVLANDSEGRAILGVLDTGGNRSSDVLVSTDINFWTQWDNVENQELWENIWRYADYQLTGTNFPGANFPPPGAGPSNGNGGSNSVSEPSTFLLMAMGLVALFWRRSYRS